jgi:hypothetical protein
LLAKKYKELQVVTVNMFEVIAPGTTTFAVIIDDAGNGAAQVVNGCTVGFYTV